MLWRPDGRYFVSNSAKVELRSAAGELEWTFSYPTETCSPLFVLPDGKLIILKSRVIGQSLDQLLTVDSVGRFAWETPQVGPGYRITSWVGDRYGDTYVLLEHGLERSVDHVEIWKVDPLGNLLFSRRPDIAPDHYEVSLAGDRLLLSSAQRTAVLDTSGNLIWSQPLLEYWQRLLLSDGRLVATRKLANQVLVERYSPIGTLEATYTIRPPVPAGAQSLIGSPVGVLASNDSLNICFTQRIATATSFEDRTLYLWVDPMTGKNHFRFLPAAIYTIMKADAYNQVYVLLPFRPDSRSSIAAFDAREGGRMLWESELLSGENSLFYDLEIGPFGTVSAVGHAIGSELSPSLMQVFRQTGLRGIHFTSNSQVGGKTVNATITFFGKCKFNRTVLLSSSTGNLSVPPTVVVPTGLLQAEVPCILSSVVTDQPATITARYSGVARTATITIKKTSLAFFGCVPNAVGGGATSTAVIRLFGPAAAGGYVIKLLSDGPEAIVPVGAIVPAGSAVRRFTIRTLGVAQTVVRALTATANGVSRTTSLTIRP
ncbi:MAG: hypothetical protein ABL949_14085 [Fimbriimonadaceae bacterium]